jgi:secondary thiamine-phosphate synthase enzyme
MAFAAEGAPTDLPPLGRAARLGSALVVRQRRLVVHTTRAAEFVDVTAPVQRIVTAAALGLGVVVVATRHTTTGLLVNEHEPLLLQDLEGLFERLAPSHACYAHDDPARRVVNLTAHERTNGHAHARAALLRTSETLAVAGACSNSGSGSASSWWSSTAGSDVSSRSVSSDRPVGPGDTSPGRPDDEPRTAEPLTG